MPARERRSLMVSIRGAAPNRARVALAFSLRAIDGRGLFPARPALTSAQYRIRPRLAASTKLPKTMAPVGPWISWQMRPSQASSSPPEWYERRGQFVEIAPRPGARALASGGGG